MNLFKNIKKVSFMLLISGFFLIGLVGCSSKSPSDTVNEYFTSITKGENGDVNNLLAKEVGQKSEDNKESEKKVSDESEKIIKDKIKQIKYTVNSENIEGEKATVNVKVNGINLGKVISNSFSKCMNESMSLVFSSALNGEVNEEANKEKMNDLFEKILIDELNSVEFDERTGDISLIKKDNKWQIEQNDDLTNLLIGEIKIH